jgi:hypothetical protein
MVRLFHMLLQGLLASGVAFESTEAGCASEDASALLALTANRNRTMHLNNALAFQQPCLCTFDIDRTLTAQQSNANPYKPAANCHWQAPGHEITGTVDDAYGRKGPMVLSDLGLHLQDSACKDCYKGIVSKGQGGDTKMHEYLISLLNMPQSDDWDGTATDCKWNGDKKTCDSNISPFIIKCNEGHTTFIAPKPKCQEKVWGFFKKVKNIDIPVQNIYHFDDILENVQAFAGSKRQARQVGCPVDQPADHGTNISKCGGKVAETFAVPWYCSDRL